MSLILADDREDEGAIPYLSAVIAENNKRNTKLNPNIGGGNISFKIKRLTVGDYCILIKDKEDSNRTILAMIIERKTWKDLAASIKDERIKRQQKNMMEAKTKKNCHALYIIEGKFSYGDETKVKNILFKSLHTTIRRNTIRGIPFIQSSNEKHTAKIVVDLARDILKLYRTGEIDFPNTEIDVEKTKIVEKQGGAEIMEIQKNSTPKVEDLLNDYCREITEINKRYREKLLSSGAIPNVIDEINRIVQKAKDPNLVISREDSFEEINELDDYSVPDTILNRVVHEDSDIILSMWTSLPGISDKSAVQLVEKYHISDIICANGKEIAKIKGEIADIKFPQSGIRFGEARTAKIMGLAYKGEEMVKKEHLHALSVGIISKIPGFSDVIAKIILAKYSLRDICGGFVQADNICELKNKNGRRLNLGSSQKLIDLLIKPTLKKTLDDLVSQSQAQTCN